MQSATVTRKAADDRPQKREEFLGVGAFDFLTPLELYECVTEEYHRNAILIEQERSRIAAIVLTSSSNGESRAAAKTNSVFADQIQRDELVHLEEMSRLSQKLSFAAQNPPLSAMELRTADRHCLDAIRALEGLTKPPTRM
ncbi:hypothetical protein ABL78_0294 [Leptomonas seymouri]|uniref:Uncharacterized protein n=1 Tax=Leptomonas seymouri TaxID=5684 RepID=A0A0N1I8Y3_LEPSE|nr:hypothetical protein ABL78_0294 [Leptomonas seymouri]|eukprot:KPI90534.1 hypothetical protein ABL78_0294 [Leptomonas seymouri]